MLYRLSPPASLDWCMPGRTIGLVQKNSQADFEKLPWEPTEKRTFSNDFLRIAVRHGVASSGGIVLDFQHVLELHRANELLSFQMAADQAHANLRATPIMQVIRQMFPRLEEENARLDEGVRASIEAFAHEADEELAKVLAAAAQPELVAHWRRLGGHYPD